MIEKIKCYLDIYQHLIEKFVEKNRLSVDQKKHIFKTLTAPTDESKISKFERLNQVELPTGYRRFLIEIGNGTGNTWESAGMGPDLGILQVLFTNNQCFIFDDFLIDLQQPFLFSDTYNLEDCEEIAEQFNRWLEIYHTEFSDKLLQGIEPTHNEFLRFTQQHGENPRDCYYEQIQLNGILPICGIGCGEYYFLVVNGLAKGEIWIDSRDLWGGISPVLNENGCRQNFDEWYLTWLKTEIHDLESKLDHTIK